MTRAWRSLRSCAKRLAWRSHLLTDGYIGMGTDDTFGQACRIEQNHHQRKSNQKEEARGYTVVFPGYSRSGASKLISFCKSQSCCVAFASRRQKDVFLATDVAMGHRWKMRYARMSHAMNQEKDDYHALIRSLNHRWDDEDEARDELERRAKEMFLESEANQLFAPIE